MRNPFRTIKDGQRILHEHGFYGTEALRIFFDMFYCRKKFHCTINEYFNYKFYNYKNRMRKNFLLKYHTLVAYDLVNLIPEIAYEKDKEYTIFYDKIAREWMRVTSENRTELEGFIRKHGKVIFKPNYGLQGSGIFAFTADEIKEHLTEKLAEIAEEPYLCEQYLIQHPKLAEMNPGSVNTMRIVTLCDGHTVKMVFGSLRTGVGDNVCDNMSSGGVGTVLDMETGISITPGIDFKNNHYFYHPVSGIKMIGFEIPFWDEVKAMVTECALRVPKAAILGWDIAITENGPCIIEVNSHPSAGKAAQIATGRPQGEEIINYINENRQKYYKKTPDFIKARMKRYG